MAKLSLCSLNLTKYIIIFLLIIFFFVFVFQIQGCQTDRDQDRSEAAPSDGMFENTVAGTRGWLEKENSRFVLIIEVNILLSSYQ